MTNVDMNAQTQTDYAELTAEVVAAYVANNSVVQTDVPQIIRSVHAALAGLASPVQPEIESKPAVSVRSSVQADKITCLNCGKKFKTIKRHLMVHHELSPEDYRKHWGLKPDYPMVAPNYASVRSDMAKVSGLGKKGR